MTTSLHTYFAGEKHAGLMLAAIGLVMLVASIVLVPARWELRAFAITLGVWSLLELAVGLGLYFKTGPQVAKLVEQLATDSAAFVHAERPRMIGVQRNFVIIEVVWLVLIVASAIAAVWLKQRTVSPAAQGLVPCRTRCGCR